MKINGSAAMLGLILTAIATGAVTGCSTSNSTPAVQPDATALDLLRGDLLYSAAMDEASVADWIMEGPGELVFEDGWMRMYSPGEEGHHVFWNPEDFPESFVAQWSVQSLETDAGLAIIFFAAKAANGKDIFDPSLPPRDGTFKQYTEGAIKSYHISYYANAAHNPDRGHANLRKNNTFTLLQTGEEGIPADSDAVHQVILVKDGAHISMFVDGRKIIDFVDDGIDGPPLTDGKIGLRQMQWTHMRYRDFKVWELNKQGRAFHD